MKEINKMAQENKQLKMQVILLNKLLKATNDKWSRDYSEFVCMTRKILKKHKVSK